MLHAIDGRIYDKIEILCRILLWQPMSPFDLTVLAELAELFI